MADNATKTASMAQRGTYEYEPRYGSACTIRLRKTRYESNNSLAVLMESEADWAGGDVWEPYATLTVNIVPESDDLAGTNMAFVDANNLGDGIVGWLEANGIAKATGVAARSGYCTYPQVEFCEEAFWGSL